MLTIAAVWLIRYRKLRCKTHVLPTTITTLGHHTTHGPTPDSTCASYFELLSDKSTADSSDSSTAMIPTHALAATSSQLGSVLNCQLFTQEITEAVILCKYSR